MKKISASDFYYAKFVMFIVSILVTVCFIFFSRFYSFFPTISDVDVVISYFESNEQLISQDLLSEKTNWNELDKSEKSLTSEFVYVKFQITNNFDSNKKVCIINNASNNDTELLKANTFNVVTIGIFGDEFPFSSLPITPTIATFMVEILPNTTETYFLECTRESDISLKPIVLQEDTWLNSILFERCFLIVLMVLILFFAINFIIRGFLSSQKVFRALGLLFLSLFLFYIRQNRFLLILLGRPYPEWLYSLTIGFNQLSSLLLLYAILPYVSVHKKRTFVIFGSCIVICMFCTVCLNLFIADYVQNIVSIFLLGGVLYFLIPLFIKGNLQVIYVFMGLLPWLVIVTIDTISVLLRYKPTILTEWSPLLSVLCSQLLLTFFRGAFNNTIKRDLVTNSSEYFMSFQDVNLLSAEQTEKIPIQIVNNLILKVSEPLEIIKSSAYLIKSTISAVRLTALSNVIEKQILDIQKQFGIELNSFSDKTSMSSSKLDLVELQEYSTISSVISNVNICLYGRGANSDYSIKMILQSQGISCVVEESSDIIVEKIIKEQYNMLIIDITGMGEKSFNIVERIRHYKNLIMFPILMIVDYYSNYYVATGFLAGVNDFIIRPFDSAEIVSRIYSMLKQRNLFEQNELLHASENEKRTFLYFVTHNINTPLTLLINRVEELNSVVKDSESSDSKVILDDIKQSVNEIDDIIQNILISFRLSDGRYVNKKVEVNITDLLFFMRISLDSKATLREQIIEWNVATDFPLINCDKNALRGILVNLIDNAIKYSPENTVIRVKAFVTNNKACIRVHDAGDGIPKEKQDVVFNRFSDRSNKNKVSSDSIGLGLYVAYELAKINNILLEYQNTPTTGSYFSLTFSDELNTENVACTSNRFDKFRF